jgi:hypothetical protein
MFQKEQTGVQGMQARVLLLVAAVAMSVSTAFSEAPLSKMHTSGCQTLLTAASNGLNCATN